MLLNNKRVISISFAIFTSIFLFVFFKYSVNFPFYDDFEAILNFLNTYHESSPGSFYELLFKQHNEHVIVLSRVFYFFLYKINFVNFSFINFVGNLSLVFLSYFWLNYFKNNNFKSIYIIPVFLMLYSFTNWENLFFAMASFSNLYVVLFSVLTLYFLSVDTPINSKYNYSFYLSLLFLFLSMFSMGSGVILPIIGVLILVISKRNTDLKVWLLFSAIFYFLYFFQYTKPENHPNPLDVFNVFDSFVAYFLIFIGSFSSFYDVKNNYLHLSLGINMVLGILILVYIIYLFVYKRLYKDKFLSSLILFVLMVALLNSANRVGFGTWMAAASRYRIYSVLLMLTIYVSTIKYTEFLKNRSIVFTLSLILILISLYQFQFITDKHQKDYWRTLMSYKDNDELFLKYQFDSYKSREILKKSESNKIYSIPSIYSYSYFVNENPFVKVSNSDFQVNQTANVKFNLEKVKVEGKFIYFEGWAYLNDISTQNTKIEMYLIENRSCYKIFTDVVLRQDLNSYFDKQNLEMGGFMCLFDTKKIEKGDYSIGLRIVMKDKSYDILTKKIIKI